MGVSQIIETERENGYTEITVINDKGGSATERYLIDCDRQNAIDRAIERSLEKEQ